MYLLFSDINEKNKVEAIDSLIKDSTATPSFFFLVVMSVLMAALGLLINNASVIIGSMLIAPILSPILSLALGLTLGDNKLINRSAITLAKSLVYAILISAITTWVLWGVIDGNTLVKLYNPEILSRTQPSIVYLLIAIIAGFSTAYARVKPELNETLPGTAIAVALVPPIATIGIGVATFNISVASGALSMFVLNGIGIIVSAMIMFSMMNIYAKKKTAEKSIKKADKEHAAIIKKAEAAKEKDLKEKEKQEKQEKAEKLEKEKTQ